MPKVFVASLHRNGTRSTHQLLQSFGLKSIHHPDDVSIDFKNRAKPISSSPRLVYEVVKPLFDQADAFSDTPFNIYYPRLFRKYQNAQFIVLTRPVKKWVRSVRRHTENRALGTFERTQYAFLTGRSIKMLTELSDYELMECYYRYHADLLKFFAKNGPDRLLITDLEDPETPERIARMIGVTGVQPAMPHVTDTSDIKAQHTLRS